MFLKLGLLNIYFFFFRNVYEDLGKLYIYININIVVLCSRIYLFEILR